MFQILWQHEVENHSKQEDHSHAVVGKHRADNLRKMLNMPVAWVKPRPTLSERFTITILRCEKPVRAIIPKPAKRMLPNIMNVAYYQTHKNRQRTEETLGKNLAEQTGQQGNTSNNPVVHTAEICSTLSSSKRVGTYRK